MEGLYILLYHLSNINFALILITKYIFVGWVVRASIAEQWNETQQIGNVGFHFVPLRGSKLQPNLL